MKPYIGTKQILARSMSIGEFKEYMQDLRPYEGSPDREGYLVEYTQIKPGSNKNHPDHEGYVSWSPKAEFEAAYNQSGNLTYGQALIAMQAGKCIYRRGWAEKKLFVFAQVPAEIPAEIIPKMQSLPEGVKEILGHRKQPIRYSNQMAILKADNSIHGWVASVSDSLATDWCIAAEGLEDPEACESC